VLDLQQQERKFTVDYLLTRGNIEFSGAVALHTRPTATYFLLTDSQSWVA